MAAASSPSVESLADLPVEEPAEGALAAAAPTDSASAAAAAAPTPAKAADVTQTLEFLNPELLLASDGAPATAAAAHEPEAPQVLEVDPDAPLTLEDTFEVDKMLSTPPPAPNASAPAARAASAAAPPPLALLPDTDTPSAGKSAPASGSSRSAPAANTGSSGDAAPAGPALVPLARRASLTAAAMKLAAASVAPPQPAVKPPKPVAPPAPVAPAKPRAAPTASAAPVTPIAKAAAVVTPTTPAASAAPAATMPADAPSLAAWANARAAAASAKAAPASATPRPSAPVAKPAPATPAEKAKVPSAKAAPPAVAPAAEAAAAAAAATGSPPRGMDRDFIDRNQVVERYLSGKLPIKAATDFERYCKEHPRLLDELGLPERVNAGLRLLEASGKPEPWQEASRPLWQQPAAILGIAGLAVILALSLAIVAAGSSGKSHRILELQRQVVERTLDAATSTRVIRLLPNRSGASNTPAIVIGGHAAQLVDFRIDETRSPYKAFRVTIDRIDEGRVMVIDNLSKDSNGHLRVAVNSSAFGPGNYLLTIEGLNVSLQPQPDSWVTVGVAQR